MDPGTGCSAAGDRTFGVATTGSGVWSVQEHNGARVLLGYLDGEGWRTVAIPEPSGSRVAAAGSRVLVYPGSHEMGGLVVDRVYDPDTGAWSELPADPIGSAYDRTFVGVDNGVVLLAIPRVDVPRPDRPRVFHAARFDDTTGVWRNLPPSTIPGYTDSWYRRGDRIVNPTLGAVDGGEVNGFDRAYELGGVLVNEREWEPLPQFGDVPVGAGSGTLAAGGRWVVSSVRVEGAPLVALDLDTLQWRNLPAGAATARTAPGIAFAGDHLIVWGGADFETAPRGALHNDGEQIAL